MRIPFVGSAYTVRSLNADAQRAVNCYVEMDNKSPRAPLALYGTPGLDFVLSLGNGPVRGFYALGNSSWAVSGNQVYFIPGNTLIPKLLGTIATFDGSVSMACDGTQTLLVDGGGAWVATGSSLVKVSDGDFPFGVRWAAYVASYFVVSGDGSGQFYFSENPNDPFSWNGLDFASAEGSPDQILGMIANQLELWFFGEVSTEIYVMTGDANQPFQRSGNTFIEHGTAAAQSPVKLDNTVFWLGSGERGGLMVWRAEGYTPARVSNHAIEREMESYSDVSDARAYTYQQEGHAFYVLTFPSADRTWVYDVATNEWHQRAWRDPQSGFLRRHRSNCHMALGGRHLVGDFENGNVYALNLDTFTDNGDPILRLRATSCQDSPDAARMFYRSLQVDMEVGESLAGQDAQLMLRYSNDGGHSWSGIKTKSIGKPGEYGRRVKFGPTGAGRNRVWEISMSDNAKFAVLGAYLEAEPGQ